MHTDRLGAHTNVAAADRGDFAFRNGANTFCRGRGGILRLMFARDDDPAVVV